MDNQHNKYLLHGLALKVFSLGTRLAFLVLIVPQLSSGEFSDYYYILTISLLITHLVSFGIVEQIPIELKKKNTVDTSVLTNITIALSTVAFILLITSVSFLTNALILTILVFVFLSGSIIAGVSRSRSPFYYDFYSNLPWILGLAIILIIKPQKANEILLIIACSQFTVQIAIFYFSRTSFNFSQASFKGAKTQLLSYAKKGWPKSISSLLQLLYMRSPALIAKNIADSDFADTISMALSIIEAIWQLFMVVIHRNYIKYINIINNDNVEKIFFKDTLILASSFLAISIAWPIIVWFNQILRLDWLHMFDNYVLFIHANILATGIIIINNTKYYYWANNNQYFILFFELFLVVSQYLVWQYSNENYYYSIPYITLFLNLLLLLYSAHNSASKKQ